MRKDKELAGRKCAVKEGHGCSTSVGCALPRVAGTGRGERGRMKSGLSGRGPGEARALPGLANGRRAARGASGRRGDQPTGCILGLCWLSLGSATRWDAEHRPPLERQTGERLAKGHYGSGDGRAARPVSRPCRAHRHDGVLHRRPPPLHPGVCPGRNHRPPVLRVVPG